MPADREPELVRVALPGGAEELFTYRVPEELGHVAPGTRVLVPFGPRRLSGLVVEPAEPDDVPEDRLRDVLLVLDQQPSLSPALLELARFVASYYLCGLGDVLRAMAPGGPAGSVLVRLTDRGRLALAGSIRGKRQRAVLAALASTDRLSESGLRRRTGSSSLAATLRNLQGKGLIAVEETLRGGSSAREEPCFAALDSAETAELPVPPPRARLQCELLAALRAAGGPRTPKQLAERLDRSTAGLAVALRALCERGLAREGRLRIGRRPESPPGDVAAARRDSRRTLAEHQELALTEALALIEAARFEVLLIEGVTGSGKTEVYLRALARAIERGRTGLYLVPEISITPLLLRTVRARFGERTAVLHSGLSVGERHDERQRILEGEVDLVVGARSAVFAPLPRLGLIVVDEEHESSYKQDAQPRYHARDVAVARGRIEGVPLLLGSATPSLESYRNALEGRYRLRRLPERVGGSRPAAVEIVDLRAELRLDPQGGFLSRTLRTALDETLAAGQQAIILLNRRGWADFLLCRECGEPERCSNCAVTLTVHLKAGELACHYCDLRRSLPESCRSCAGSFLQNVGEGTQQLEVRLRQLLPGIPLARLDRDVARRKGAATQVLADFEAGRTRILLGTQMIAKGHDFPGVTLVGVLQADRSLWLPDFRAAERTFQLITQVAGRAGRRLKAGRVVVQSLSPDHPALLFAAQQDYPPFYESEAAGREALGYPPFARLVSLVVSAQDEAAAAAQAARLGSALRASCLGIALVLGPAPAPLARLRDRFRFQILVKSRGRKRMHWAVRRALAEAPAREGTQVEVDVDPQALL